MQFDQPHKETLDALASFPSRMLTLPPEFASATRTEQEGELQLDTKILTLTDLGEFRSACMRSAKINILVLFFYPLPKWQLPIYVMEMVVLGKRPVVAVIDITDLQMELPCVPGIRQSFQQLRQRHPHIVESTELPEWYQLCRSGYDFFVRPDSQTILADMIRVHNRLWQEFVCLLHTPLAHGEEATVQYDVKIQQYKRHHRLNFPGSTLLKRSFGNEWTAEYLGILFR